MRTRHQRIQLLENRQGSAKEVSARLCRPHTTARSLEDSHANRVFELHRLNVDCRRIRASAARRKLQCSQTNNTHHRLAALKSTNELLLEYVRYAVAMLLLRSDKVSLAL